MKEGTLELGNGLEVAKEKDGGIRVGDGSEGLEKVPEASEPQEGEIGRGVTEAGAERLHDVPVQPPAVKGGQQLPRQWLHRRARRRFGRSGGWPQGRATTAAPMAMLAFLFEVHGRRPRRLDRARVMYV